MPARLSEFSLVAGADGAVIGLVIAVRRSTRDLVAEIGRDAFPEDELYLDLQDLIVAKAERGNTIGSMLVNDVISRAKAAGIHRSMAYSANADYIRTARFYESCGFRMWHIFRTQ